MSSKPASSDERSRSALTLALRRLGLRDHSECELQRLLARGGFDADEITTVLDRLRRERLLDDARYARRHAALRIGSRGMGRNRVRAELRRRGVNRETVESGITAALVDVSETEALDSTARSYWRRHARVAVDARRRRLFAFLLRRGFASGLITERLRSLWPEWKGALDELEMTSLSINPTPDEDDPGRPHER